MGGTRASAAETATAYRCETPDGPVFSDRPCGEGAETFEFRRERKPQAPPTASPRGGAAAPIATDSDAAAVDPALVMRAFLRTREEVRALLGPPAAAYRAQGIEHWFYPNIERSAPEPGQPELRFQEERLTEVNWLSPLAMARARQAAGQLSGWRPPTRTKPKDFAGAGLRLAGIRREELLERFGQPDDKRLEEGMEVWRYEQVPERLGAPPDGRLSVTLDGDQVIASRYR